MINVPNIKNLANSKLAASEFLSIAQIISSECLSSGALHCTQLDLQLSLEEGQVIGTQKDLMFIPRVAGYAQQVCVQSAAYLTTQVSRWLTQALVTSSLSVFSDNTMPETQAQRPTRRKLVYEDDSEVYGQTAEVSKERCFNSDKASRQYHIQLRIRNLESGRSPQSSQCEEASQAFDMREYTLAARIYQEILSYCEVDSSAKNGFQDSVVVQICLNLTECYLRLQSPKEAESVLFQLWHPEGKYTIGATHPLCLETARLYSRLQKQLKGAIEKNGEETYNQEEEQLVKELELFYMYGYQYFKTGFPEKAGGIYRHGLQYLKESGERLGLHHAATTQDIQKAYLRLTRFFHPDKGGDTGVMQQLLEAYQTLSHEAKRSKYDYLSKCNCMR
ncbi:uncharacterized protein MELLADRAFT_110631 [Melampsora larici-populina 98AG31]|uniref:J domain-containing protein n=1 Tax=Melampsora larici-populina (strain 98AG31 / pathotype 3-4-7) TaxID=747676 RepID=F4S0F7_MELLP|nr:uncharacterized protein MELLADRAFT_110631 [Melampsora larici-populina 98AG31]EGG01874.1 hypothetical protein MELLADRAFT_110631 [Melampsora larici-populina 98AG31]